jgi:transposase
MSENFTELSRPLVVGRKSDGRAVYDKQAKRELIEICLSSKASLASIARHHSLNANLLHNWMVIHRRRGGASAVVTSNFVPVQVASTDPADGSRSLRTYGTTVGVELVNGVKLDLGPLSVNQLAQVLELLNGLPCSASTRV